jgi:hypothetical protein
METVTTILAGRLADAKKAMAKMEKKARRYNVPFSVTYGEPRLAVRERPNGKKYTVNVVDVTLHCTTPKVGEYNFLASVELTSAGNFVDTVPGVSVDPSFRDTDNHCDHCGTTRNRKHVYIVCDVNDGRQLQVGRTCLRDFLGIDDPHWIIQAFKFWRMLAQGGGCESFGGMSWYEYLDTLLAATNACIRLWGWTSKGQAKYDETLRPTADRIASLYGTDKFSREEAAAINASIGDADHDLAQEVIEWVRSSTDQSDYMHNLRLACYDDVLWDWKRIALAISAVSAFHRAKERELKLAQRRELDKDSGHVGYEGERLRGIKARLEMARGMGDNGYGWTTLYKFRDDAGNLYTWFTGSAPHMDVGNDVVLDGTVKRHNEYQGIRETQLTRAKVVNLSLVN